jgi:hypothetical protein
MLNFLPYRHAPGAALPLGLTRFELPPPPPMEGDVPFEFSIHATELMDRMDWSVQGPGGAIAEHHLRALSEGIARTFEAMGAAPDQPCSALANPRESSL